MDTSQFLKFWSGFVLVSTPYLAQGLKMLMPVWEKRLGKNYVFVVMGIGIVLNLVGYSLTPDQIGVTTDLMGTITEVASAAVSGAGLAFGGSKLYDMNKKEEPKPVCKPVTRSHKKKTPAKKAHR
jgi:hypothetical protein